MTVTLLLNDGKISEEKINDLGGLIDSLNSRRQYLHDLNSGDLIEFFAKLAFEWSDYKEIYAKNIINFLKRENLERSLNISLHGDMRALDDFVDLGDSKLLFHAQPRGLSVQWLAGNVPMMGLFSIISAVLTKNPCLVKASANSYEELISKLLSFYKIKTDKIDGGDLLKCISVVLLDHNDLENQKSMSLSADTRVVWGGQEVVELINRLPKQPFCEDIIFGPKYSYALIDKESLDRSFNKLASRLAVDVAVFDQYACSSPHVVFVESGGQKTPLDFSHELAKQLEIIGRTLLPKQKIASDKTLEIVELRAEYILSGDKVIAPESTEWTVVYSDQGGLVQGCYSRFIVVKAIEDFSELANLNNRQKQTLGIALTDENKKKWLDEITFVGIDRCPDLGFATFFESPWDGLFLFDRLVRWVTIYK